MIGYREQVESALRAVAVTSATSYTWFGRRSRPLPPAVAAALAPAAAREFLIGGLESELYRWFYTQGRPVPVGAKDGARRLDRALVEALSRVNSGAGGWEPGWRVESRRRGTAVIVRDGLRARVPVSQCREGGRRLVPGALVSVRRPKETLAGSPGFYTALGDTEPSAGRAEVRVYFNITVEGATPLVDTGTRVLNRARIPFDLKVVGDPGGFDRCDAAVLYLDDGDFERARESLRTLVSSVPAAPARRAAGVREAARPRGRRRRAPAQPGRELRDEPLPTGGRRAGGRPRKRRAPARGSDRRRRPPLRGSRTRHRRPVSGAWIPGSI